eukprot:gene4931-5173_t
MGHSVQKMEGLGIARALYTATGSTKSKSKTSKAANAKKESIAANKKPKAPNDPQVAVNASWCVVALTAVRGLTSDQKMLSKVVAATVPQMMPQQLMSEAVTCIKDCLFAAVAAHSFRQMQASFRAGQLLRGGYSGAELIQSSQADLRHLRAAGVSVQELYAHLPRAAAAQLSGVGGAAALREAGYSAAAVQSGAPDGALSVWDMKLAGYGVSTAGFCPFAADTRNKLVLAGKASAAPEPQTSILLAADPVKMAQMRRKSATGSMLSVANNSFVSGPSYQGAAAAAARSAALAATTSCNTGVDKDGLLRLQAISEQTEAGLDAAEVKSSMREE